MIVELEIEQLRDWVDALYIIAASLSDDGRSSMAGVVSSLANEISAAAGFEVMQKGEDNAS